MKDFDNRPGSDRRDLDHSAPIGVTRRNHWAFGYSQLLGLGKRRAIELLWETDRYRMADVCPRSAPPALREDERIVSIAAHPMGMYYLIEKGPAP